jgi:hypothetical protein
MQRSNQLMYDQIVALETLTRYRDAWYDWKSYMMKLLLWKIYWIL